MLDNKIRLLQTLVLDLQRTVYQLREENAELEKTLKEKQEIIESLKAKSDYAILQIDEVIDRLRSAAKKSSSDTN